MDLGSRVYSFNSYIRCLPVLSAVYKIFPDMEKRFLTTGELAALSGISPTTIFRAIVNKTIAATTTPGGHYRIPRNIAETFLRNNGIPVPWESARAGRVLVVEDNQADVVFFKRALGRVPGVDVRVARSGYEAGFMTLSFRPDLLILDVFLSDLDGRQVAKMIRSDDRLKDTKIVAVTATRDQRELKDIRTHGFDAVLTKPVDPGQLRSIVDDALRLLKSQT